MNKKHSSPKLDIKKLFKNAKPMDYFLIGGIALLTVTIVTITVVLINQFSQPVSAQSTSLSEITASVIAENKNYDKDKDKIDVKEYNGTVLEETKEEGTDYTKGTLFIGDSNTVRSMSYGQTTLDNNVAAVSMGIQHVTSKPIVYFKGMNDPVTVPKAVSIIQPQRIIITYGTNNTIGWSAETFVDEYKKALDAIVKAYPYADIIINAIPPIDIQRENMQITMKTIDSFNAALAKLAKKEGYKFLNSAEALKDEKTGYAKADFTISDGIHLNKKGNEAWFKYVRTHSFVTEDKRPKPLKTVPGRKETPPDIITEDPLAIRGEKAKGIKIIFSAAEGGSIEGSKEQNVKSGVACTTVKAVPSAGYMFTGWACSVGSINDVKAPSLTFTVPIGVTDKEISVSASFKKAGMFIVNSGGSEITSLSLNIGESYAIGAAFKEGYIGNKAVTFTSASPNVVSVSGGTLTAVSEGTAKITAYSEGNVLSASIDVKVMKKVSTLADFTLNHTSLTLNKGDVKQLVISTVTPADVIIKNKSFSSDNSAVATVDANGNITVVGYGSAIITCTADGISHTCTVTANAPTPPPPPPDSSSTPTPPPPPPDSSSTPTPPPVDSSSTPTPPPPPPVDSSSTPTPPPPPPVDSSSTPTPPPPPPVDSSSVAP
ncbi:MAG: Ig-like domain-containing protein [Oscillospiraceae bacterium]